MSRLINQKAVRQLVKDMGRVPTSGYLTAVDEHLRETIARQCMSVTQGARMRRDAFVGVPASPRK